MKILFLDETGDHNLLKIDPQYPLFMLGGIIVDRDYYESTIIPSVNEFKLNFFGCTDIILHTADITRNRNGFECLVDPDIRKRFYEGLNALMSNLEYRVVACAIFKKEHLSRYGIAALDPYLLSLHVLVERFCLEIGFSPYKGTVIAEKRGEQLDRQLDLAWKHLCMRGTPYIPARIFRNRIDELRLHSKKENIIGLQLADLVISPIARKLLGKQTRQDWEIVESKFRRGPHGEIDGYGLIVLPRKE